ncbi:MAG: hypothetical protein JW768_01100 [Chitinispirillaceae bacterium]|nr:hypothetical protein [Chitinispirillaceae bacterium]
MGSVLEAIIRLDRPVFATRELHVLRGGSLSSLVQSLRFLEKQGAILHLRRGLWMLALGGGNERYYPYVLAHHLIQGGPAYISFTSALHLHGIIGQIPQSITVASTTHTRTVRTRLGTFFVHRIAPSFFKGYEWYRGPGSFLIATPEKALIDCLYVSTRRNRNFTYFPEMSYPRSFSKRRAREWVRRIEDKRIRAGVLKKLGSVLSGGAEDG